MWSNKIASPTSIGEGSVYGGKRSNRRVRPGDIYAVLLPNKMYRFVRVLNDAAVGVYRCQSDSMEKVPETDDYEFFVCVYKEAYRNWEFVRHKDFASEEEAWPPPFCWVDALTERGSIYYHGERRPCKFEDCKDLEILAVWDAEQLTKRLMGDERWKKAMRYPKRGTLE